MRIKELYFILFFKEKVNDSSSKSSQLASRPGAQPYSAPAVSLDNDDGISYKGEFIFLV